MLIQSFPRFLLIALLFHLSIAVQAQSDTSAYVSAGNSCQSMYARKQLSIHYSYTISTQTHDYSGNWDFDGDTETDSLFFIGTGGGHLYFYLRIVLSSDKKVREFNFLNIDMPCLGDISELKEANFYPPPLFPQFVVDPFHTGALGDNANDKIYLCLDQYSEIPAKWKKRGATSRYLFLFYKDGEIIIRNFIE